MSEDPIKAYQDALQDFNSATKEAEGLVMAITSVANALRDWKRVTVADNKTGFPLEAHGYSINPDNWPTIQQIAEVLSGWHRVRHVMNNKWNAIPHDRRVGLQPPPSD